MVTGLVITAFLAAAGGTPSLAEPDFSTVNVPTDVARFCAEHLATQLTVRGLKVVTSREISELIGQQRQKELLGCGEASESCMAELANALGTDGVIFGSLGKLGQSYQVNVKVVKSGSADPLATWTRTVKSDEELLPSLTEAAETLAPAVRVKLGYPALSGSGPTTVSEGAPNRHWPVWPTVAAAVFAAAGGTLHVLSNSDADALRTGRGITTPEQAQGIYNTATAFRVSAFVGYGLAAASLGAASYLYLRGEQPSATQVSFAPSGNGGALVISGVLP